jgi:multidrug efflux pump subunit AcrB
MVPLKDVADVGIHTEPTAISHDDVLRDVTVTARVTGDPAAVVTAVRSRLPRMPMPQDYHAEVFGNAAVARAGVWRALGYAAAALIGIFLLLQAAVASWRRAWLLMLSLPLSAVNGACSPRRLPGACGAWDR